MRAALALVLVAFAAAGCAPPSPGPKVQAMLDFYAPDLQIGDFISPAAHKRYPLEVSPYRGYRDGTFKGPDGVVELIVGINTANDENVTEISPLARVVNVTLSIPDSSMFLVEGRLLQEFGAPRQSCYKTTGTRGRWLRLYWPGKRGRGILLTLVRGRLLEDLDKPLGPFEPPPAGSGWVTFGAPAPDFEYVEPDDCAK